MFSNSNSNIATTVATAAAAAANTRSSSVASRSSPYNYATAAAGAAAYGTNVNMHHHQNPQYQDYSMYPTMDPMAWHATYAAAAYRGYEAATAVSDIWPPQSYPHAAAHMNMLPNNDLSEASSSLNLAAAESNFLASASNGGLASSTASASNQRSNSPSEYKVFNNNESRENEVKPLTVRPSPDSGLAASEAMSNSGSPNANGGHNLVSQGSPIPGSNLVVRPSAARSPYEWMRKPSNGLQARPKEGKIFVRYFTYGVLKLPKKVAFWNVSFFHDELSIGDATNSIVCNALTRKRVSRNYFNGHKITRRKRVFRMQNDKYL